MNPRNLRRTRAFVLVPIAALTASVVALEARDGATPTSIQSDAATTTSSPSSTPSTALAAPTTVSTPPVTAAPGAVSAPASVTRGGAAALGVGLPPLRARAALIGAPSGAGAAVNAAATSSISSVALAAYQRAASVIDQADSGCRLDWELLAGIGQIESGNGTTGGSQLTSAGVASPAIYGPALTGRKHTARVLDTDNGAIDGDKRYDRAVGPMQILPATWVQIAVDGDGDGRRDPQDINDAALASAVYLCSTGADLSNAAARQTALLRYNHSASYAAQVLAVAAAYAADDESATIPATLMLPPGAASTTPSTTPAEGGDKPKHKHHHKHAKHPRHHGHHAATGIASDGSTQAQQPTKPASPPVKPSAATADQLADLCRPAIVKTYPSATDDAIDAATAECVTKLTGQTLAKARAEVADVVTDPKLAADVPALGPAVSTTPTDTASGTPTSDPSDTPSGTPSDAPSDAPSDGGSASSDSSGSSASTSPSGTTTGSATAPAS